MRRSSFTGNFYFSFWMSALRKNPGVSIGKVSKTRIFRLNEDNLKIVDSMAGCLLLQERESLRISALRKNPGFSIGKVSKTRIFRLNADTLNECSTGFAVLSKKECLRQN